MKTKAAEPIRIGTKLVKNRVTFAPSGSARGGYLASTSSGVMVTSGNKSAANF